MDTPMPTEELVIRCLALKGATEYEAAGLLALIPKEIQQLDWLDWLEENQDADMNQMTWAALDIHRGRMQKA